MRKLFAALILLVATACQAQFMSFQNVDLTYFLTNAFKLSLNTNTVVTRPFLTNYLNSVGAGITTNFGSGTNNYFYAPTITNGIFYGNGAGITNTVPTRTNVCFTIQTPNTNLYVIAAAASTPALVGSYTQDVSRFPNGFGCYYYTNTSHNGFNLVEDFGLSCNPVDNFEIQSVGGATYYSITALQTSYPPASPDSWRSNGAPSVHLTGNWSTNYSTNCVTVAALAVPPLNTNLIWIDPNGNDYNGIRGRPDVPFQHLYNVLTQAVSGDTIFVNPGNYTETAFFNSQLPPRVSIVGPGATAARITQTVGNGTSYLHLGDSNTISGLWMTNYVLYLADSSITSIPVTNVLMKDMRITSQGDTIIFGANGFWNPKVINCDLDGNSDKLADFTASISSPDWVTNSTIFVQGGRLSGSAGANGFGWTVGRAKRQISGQSLHITGKDIANYSYGLNADFASGTNGFSSDGGAHSIQMPTNSPTDGQAVVAVGTAGFTKFGTVASGGGGGTVSNNAALLSNQVQVGKGNGLIGNAGGSVYIQGTNVIDMGGPTNSARVIIGNGAGQTIVTSTPSILADTEDTLIGRQAGFNLLGTYNEFSTAIGSSSLGNMTNGTGVVAIGQKAFNSGTNVAQSTAIGAKAGANVPNAHLDVFIGYNAGVFASIYTTDGQRTYIGNSAGQNASGDENIFIGSGSGPQSGNNTSANNTGIGNSALQSLTTGQLNTAIGWSAGQSITDRSAVTAIGYQAMGSGSGSLNGVAIGYQAGLNVSGAGDILIGALTGQTRTTNSHMMILGGNDNNTEITDVFIGRDSDSASAAANPVHISSTYGLGSNNGGSALSIFAGSGTGNANGGDLGLGVGLAGSSGTSSNLPTTELTISGTNGQVYVNSGVSISGSNFWAGAMTYATNNSQIQPDMNIPMQFMSTNAAFQFLSPIHVDTANKKVFQTCAFYVYNSSGSAILASPPANAHAIPATGMYITNVSRFTVEIYPDAKVGTNFYCQPVN